MNAAYFQVVVTLVVKYILNIVKHEHWTLGTRRGMFNIWLALLLCQDFGVQPKTILNLWQSHKMAHRDTQEQLVLSRERGVECLVNMVQHVEAAEFSKEYDGDVALMKQSLTGKLSQLIEHDVVNRWRQQFEPHN